MNRMISELADLGWVDFDFGSSAVSQILIGLDLAESADNLGKTGDINFKVNLIPGWE